MKLVTEFKDIGKVKQSTITDGTTNFPCEVIDLGKALLIKVNGAFYLDYITHIKRLDKNDLKTYNIEKHFELDEPVVPLTRKRGKK